MRRAGALALILAGTLSGCAASASGAHRAADTLVVLESGDGATMNPLYASSQQDADVYASLLYDGLTGTGPGFSVVPDLATAWTHSPDGLHWTVELRHGVTWSDGVPFTSKDVVFTYRITQDPRTAAVTAVVLQEVRRVTADGPYRVHFELAHPTAQMESSVLGLNELPEHVLGSLPPARQLFSAFGEHPIGTGPYVLARWQHDSEIVFEANRHYWAGAPKIARIDFRILFNPQAQVDALENGSADLIPELGHSQSVRLAREAPQVRQVRLKSLNVAVFAPNLRRPGLSDVVVRRAMMYAYDRKAIIDGFLDGQGTPATSMVAPGLVRWYDPTVPAYPYDPARARALLDADGWKLGPDGVRQKGNARLHFQLLVNQGSTLLLDNMLAFAADEAAVGIKIDTRLLDFPSEIARTFAGNFDLTIEDFGGNTDPDASNVFASDQVPPVGDNTGHYIDPVNDRLLKAGLLEIDYAKRRAIYNELQHRWAQMLPMLWDVNADDRIAATPRLNFGPQPILPTPVLWYDVRQWSLDP